MHIKELFGVGVSQDASFLYIRKADLIGLTPLVNNKAEQLLAAIIGTTQSTFEGLLIDELGDLIVSESGESINYDNSLDYLYNVELWRSIITTSRNSIKYITHQFLVTEYAQTD